MIETKIRGIIKNKDSKKATYEEGCLSVPNQFAEIDRPSKIIAMSSASMANNAMLKTGADIGIVKFELATLDVWITQS